MDDFEAGQVWMWTLGEYPYDFTEVYVLIRFVPHLEPTIYTRGTRAWEALNLEAAVLEVITPEASAGDWTRVA